MLEHEKFPKALGLTERFFLALAKVPQHAERVEALHIKHHAEATFESFVKKATKLTSSHKAVLNSSKLQTLLEVILAVGNFMNGTGFRGGAYGFSITLLPKLKDTKGEGGVSLLQFIVNFLKTKESDALQILEDFPELGEAEKCKDYAVNINELQNDLKVYEKQLVVLKVAVNSQSDNPIDKVEQKLSTFVTWYEGQISEIKQQLSEASESYNEMCSYLAVDPTNEEMTDVLSLLHSFLIDFSREVSRLNAGTKRTLKVGELQVQLRMKRKMSRHAEVS